jgi:hypothetical protein
MNLQRLAKYFRMKLPTARLFAFSVFSFSVVLWSCSSKQPSSQSSAMQSIAMFASSIPVTELTLIRALPVDGARGIEPSGLAIYNGDLFTISDDHDGVIYKLTLRDTCAVAEPSVLFHTPKTLVPLDFEGLTMDSVGNFYIVSETEFRILRVSKAGDAEWITPSLKLFGEAKGLFQTWNAYFEGVAFVDSSHFFLCAERSPRGLMSIDVQRFPDSSSALVCDDSPFEISTPRVPDFADVFWEKGNLYALHRAVDAVSLLDVKPDSAIEKSAWSFHETVMKPGYMYGDMKFGHAEGFCMDAEKIYVILDNNNDHRLLYPNDTRPMLFIFQRPKAQ